MIDTKLLSEVLSGLGAMEKSALVPPGGMMPPDGGGMPPGGAPMDPAMAGAPMDPAMAGAPPMDPAMTGMPPGAPPMDPSMAGAPPMDPSMTGAPMDPAMMGQIPAPPTTSDGQSMISMPVKDFIQFLKQIFALITQAAKGGDAAPAGGGGAVMSPDLAAMNAKLDAIVGAMR